MSAKKKSPSFVIRVASEAERERTIECAEKFGITAFLVDDVPKKLLPSSLDYLGYVFLRGELDQFKSFNEYVNMVNTLAKDWKL